MPKSNPLDTSYNIGLEDRTSFDWPDVKSVLNKVDEELLELKNSSTPENQFHELGDVLFTLVQVARHLKIDPSLSLEVANQRYNKRSKEMKQLLQNDNLSFKDADLNLLEAYWKKAKEKLKTEEILEIKKALNTNNAIKPVVE